MRIEVFFDKDDGFTNGSNNRDGFFQPEAKAARELADQVESEGFGYEAELLREGADILDPDSIKK